MHPERKCIWDWAYRDNPLNDVEKKAFYSSEKRKSFGVDQKGKYHDCHHQSDENPKADEEHRRAAKLLLYPISSHVDSWKDQQ